MKRSVAVAPASAARTTVRPQADSERLRFHPRESFHRSRSRSSTGSTSGSVSIVVRLAARSTAVIRNW